MNSGRPTQEFTVARVKDLVVAPLFQKNLRWSSAELAEHIGISQSTLARCWKLLYPAQRTTKQLSAQMTLVAVQISQEASTLVFLEHSGTHIQTANEKFMRSPRRCALQAVLAADLLRDQIKQMPIKNFAKEIDEQFPAGNRKIFSTKASLKFVDFLIPTELEWQALLHDLVVVTSAAQQPQLNDLLIHLLQWARNPKTEFNWISKEEHSETPRISRSRNLSLSDALADHALKEIMKLIKVGTLHSGSRITESNLSKLMHTSRSQARDAIRSLSSAGLLNLEQNRSAVIPEPKSSDVADIYAARQALGAVIVRNACGLAAEQLKPANDALQRMLEVSSTNKSFETGEEDLTFQDALATCTGMLNIPEMIYELAAQLRMFIAVMRLSYSYPVKDMCQDNLQLMKFINDGNVEAAVAAWNTKMNDAYSYMEKQIAEWQLL
jgi:DNA-binding GntR family transcriptional regulator